MGCDKQEIRLRKTDEIKQVEESKYKKGDCFYIFMVTV